MMKEWYSVGTEEKWDWNSVGCDVISLFCEKTKANAEDFGLRELERAGERRTGQKGVKVNDYGDGVETGRRREG